MHYSYGRLIKLTRIEKNIKQEVLCEGICTPSYLSRIENDRVIADQQVYELLLNRLDIKIEEPAEYCKIEDQIEQWHEDLLYNRSSTINIQQLKESARSTNDEIYSKFLIVYTRSLISRNDITASEINIQVLLNSYDSLNQRNQYLLNDLLIIYYYKRKEYSKVINLSDRFTNLTNNESFAKPLEIGCTLYNLAHNYKCLYLYEKAIVYAKQALATFNELYALKFALKVHVLLGICYNNSYKVDEALQTYETAAKIIPFLPEENQNYHLSIIENNIGKCYENKKNYKKAIEFYLKSYERDPEKENMLVIMNIVRAYYVAEYYEQAIQWLLVATQNENIEKKYMYQIKIFKLLLFNEKISIEELKILESECFSYFKKEQLNVSIIFFSKVFAKLYKDKNYYKKATEMYELALDVYEGYGS